MKWILPGLAVLFALAVVAPFLLIPLVLAGFFVFWWTGWWIAFDRWVAWQRQPHLAQELDATLIGRSAVFMSGGNGEVWAELDGTVWPARLPPFEPAPSPGTTGVVVNVADGMLVVRPIVAPATRGSAEQ